MGGGTGGLGGGFCLGVGGVGGGGTGVGVGCLGRLVEVSVDPFGIDGAVSDSISDSWGAGEGAEERGDGEVPLGNEKVTGIRGENLFCTSISGGSFERGGLTLAEGFFDFVTTLF